MSGYTNEIVTRCAPRWAWELIDEILAGRGDLDSDGERALLAMIDACMNGES